MSEAADRKALCTKWADELWHIVKTIPTVEVNYGGAFNPDNRPHVVIGLAEYIEPDEDLLSFSKKAALLLDRMRRALENNAVLGDGLYIRREPTLEVQYVGDISKYFTTPHRQALAIGCRLSTKNGQPIDQTDMPIKLEAHPFAILSEMH